MTDERGGRYFREARFFLAGDRVAAQSHILEARSLMGYMRDLRELGGPPIQVQYATLQDGTTIKATMTNGLYQAEIVSPMFAEEDKTSGCLAFRSGLLSVEAVAEHYRTGENGITQAYNALEWLYPPTVPPQPAPDRIAVEDFARDGLIRMSEHPLAIPATYGRVFADAYSGSMRQAIQILLGAGAELTKWYTQGVGAYVYNFGYRGTHGLVKKHGYTDDAPAFWLVKMPGDGYGMLAMDFPVCNQVTDEQRASGVHWIPAGMTQIPTGAELLEAIADGSVIELMSDAAFDAAVGGYEPLFDDCGWAFSYSGHECQNALYTVETVAPGDYRVYTKRVKTSFVVSESEDGEQLISASIESLDQGLFFGGKNTLPRFPWISTVGISLYPTYDAYSAPRPSLTDNSCDCAVYVYYKGDEEQVFRYCVNDNPDEPTNTGDYYLLAPRVGQIIPCQDNWDGSTYAAGWSATYYKLNGGVINSYTHSGSGVENHYNITREGWSGPKYVVLGGGNPDYVVVEPLQQTYVNRYTRVFANRNNYAVMLVPPHQREAVFVLDGQSSPYETYTFYPRQNLGATTGDTWWSVRASGMAMHCPELVSVFISETHDKPTCQLTPEETITYNPMALMGGGAGGNGWDVIEGCRSTSPFHYAELSGETYDVPAHTGWEGSFEFFSSGTDVSLPVTEEMAANIMSTTYIAQGSSLYIHAWTDAIKPDKYIISSDVNTTLGSTMLTNTDYNLAGVDAWGKSFIGIAN